jgi:hypothetical protein
MIARCARCQGTFTTDTFGLQRCPHCGSELHLSDPNAPKPDVPTERPAAGTPGPTPPGPTSPEPGSGPVWGAPPPPPDVAGGPGPELPPPPGPPPGGYGPPPGGWGPPGGDAPGGWGAPRQPAESPASPELPSPFEERARRGFFAGFFETWKLVATQPQQFFRQVRVRPTGQAVLFGVIASTVGLWVQLLLSLPSLGSIGLMEGWLRDMPGQNEESIEMFRAIAERLGGAWYLALFVASPIYAFLRIFLAAALFHLVLSLLKSAPRGFDATLTTVAYASGIYLLEALPMCGWMVAAVWFVIATILGLSESQRCGPAKAALAVFSPLLLACLCCCGPLSVGGLFRGLSGAGGGNVDV